MPRSKNSDTGLIAAWQGRGGLATLLLPIAFLFALLVTLRRALYRAGVLRRVRLAVPVVVVGNITVGGTGKTPLILWLAEACSRHGYRPGIVSRGYGSASARARAVSADDDPAAVGDEPVLLRRRSGCPVFVGHDRVEAARALLSAHPDCNLLLSDDGLQHYRLARDIEIAVLDARGVWNGWMLPAGPLREPPARLARVDAVVCNGASGVSVHGVPTFDMRLVGDVFQRLDQPATTCTAASLHGLRLHAVAGIGNPRRFFDHLSSLGLEFEAHPFPDHSRYGPGDLDFDGDAILTTEKDAVKFACCAGLPVWVLPVRAEIEPDLAAYLLEKLDGHPPA